MLGPGIRPGVQVTGRVQSMHGKLEVVILPGHIVWWLGLILWFDGLGRWLHVVAGQMRVIAGSLGPEWFPVVWYMWLRTGPAAGQLKLRQSLWL